MATLRLVTTHPDLVLTGMVLGIFIVGMAAGALITFLHRREQVESHIDKVTEGQLTSLKGRIYQLETELDRERRDKNRLKAFHSAVISLSSGNIPDL